ncbi:hypothetical protein C8J57DRAFT_1250057 [Mycena rebaudengoi]|nr:hypothetical protein C8J57DRAFT_1250057 [Mycena rebaudengoi]
MAAAAHSALIFSLLRIYFQCPVEILSLKSMATATPSPVLRRGARERRAPLPPDKTPPAPAPVPAPRWRRGRQPDAVPDAPPVPVDPIPERRDEAVFTYSYSPTPSHTTACSGHL